uniref:Transmembrane gamma-carboxyglutamic acid protein 2-like n=1 Tax=Sinocyclocheilus anshuiensis TaxID=1608454 RepID=A0A671REE3_9TELE
IKDLDLLDLIYIRLLAVLQTLVVFLEEKSAGSFLSRKLLYNSWDFELLVPDNLQRECMEEICSYEEAREVFEDDIQTAKFWEGYVNSHGKVDSYIYIYIYVYVYALYAAISHSFFLHLHSVPVRMGVDGQPIPESVPLANRAPGLPSYNEALTHSGQHDAPPPPYSGPY